MSNKTNDKKLADGDHLHVLTKSFKKWLDYSYFVINVWFSADYIMYSGQNFSADYT